ncbi:hypothetical protein VTN77DRAFT_6833 [Rasamsonia byssochlamydoides]|uniref:uncharacterized protein n=1 Tax=Rasamsonia byssochlamydoides TaxID=89139 RepID=UPI00374442C5
MSESESEREIDQRHRPGQAHSNSMVSKQKQSRMTARVPRQPSSTTTKMTVLQSSSRRPDPTGEGSYWGPNDDKDAYHQAITHHLFCLTLEDKLFLAPVSNPRNVLDIGTGIALWATDFADAYPDAEILGTDLSPIWEDAVRPNLRLEVDDCCSKWTYLDEGRAPFDLIHMRCLFGSVADWSALYKQSFDHLVPGGYIEQAEMSLNPHSLFEGDDASLSIFHQWYHFWKQCSAKTGKSWLIADTMQQSMRDAGFEDVCEVRFKWPIGWSWASSDPRLREIGRWYREFWEVGMEGWIMALSTRYMGWTADQARDFIRKTQEVLRDDEQRIYYEVVIVYGRKPEHDSKSGK